MERFRVHLTSNRSTRSVYFAYHHRKYIKICGESQHLFAKNNYEDSVNVRFPKRERDLLVLF